MNNPIIIEQSPEAESTVVTISPRDSAVLIPEGIDRARLRELEAPYRVYLELEEGYPRSTVITYANEVSRFLKWIEENPQGITRFTFIQYREDLKGRYAPSTVNLALIGIRKFLTWLWDIGEIPSNPALGVKGIRQRGRNKAHKRDALTPGEVRRLLEIIPEDTAVGARDKALIGSMLYAGLRSVETRRARIKDYRTRGDNRVIFIQGKGKAEADDLMVIVPELERLLGNWLSYHPRGDDPEAPLFCSLSRRSYGRPLDPSSIRRMVKGHFKEAGIRDASKTTHSLRHSAISAIIRGGGTRDQAQMFARHESGDTTQIYIHEFDRLADPPEYLIKY